jgi:hypothetical protein
MLSKCANPDCTKTLRYLREGKVFKIDSAGKKAPRKVEHFWLCGDCSRTMTLVPDRLNGMHISKKVLRKTAGAS